MGYARIKIKAVASSEDLKKWEDHMIEKSKCWNKFCLGIYAENEMRAVHVVKEDNPDVVYLTTLCEDCIKDANGNEILVNETHLMVDTHKKAQ